MTENNEGLPPKHLPLSRTDDECLRQHAKSLIHEEADRIATLKDAEEGGLSQAVGRIAAMDQLLLALKLPFGFREEIFPLEQLRSWVEQHFLPEAEQMLTDYEREEELDLTTALLRLGTTLSILLRLRRWLDARHAGDDQIVKDETQKMVGTTALELARIAKRLMDQAEEAVGLPDDSAAERDRVLQSIGASPADILARNALGDC